MPTLLLLSNTEILADLGAVFSRVVVLKPEEEDQDPRDVRHHGQVHGRRVDVQSKVPDEGEARVAEGREQQLER